MASKIFPALTDHALSELISPAEARFYRACRDTLPNNLLILHSLSIIDTSDGKRNRVGECDFVIFDPENGILVVEVKGGGIEFDPKASGSWYSTNRHGARFEIKDPFKQSENYRFRILSLIKKQARGLKNIYFPAGHSVAFPDLDDISSIVAHNRPREIIALSEDLSDLSAWYERSIKFWNKSANKEQQLGKLGLSEIEKILLKPIIATPLLSHHFKLEEEQRFKLTDEQARLTKFLQHYPRANITGGAGTGKTVVAKELATQFSDQGLETIFLCFNKALGDQLRGNCAHNERITAGSYHSFFTRLLRQSTNDYEEEAKNAYPKSDYWNVVLPYAYVLASEASPKRYDAIIIDEAQDLSAESWMAIEELLNDETSKFFTFSDTNQRFYSRINSIPELSLPFILYSNCRNTKNIHEAAYKDYTGPKIEPPPIQGEPVQVCDDTGIPGQLTFITRTIKELLNVHKFQPEQIMILIADSLSEKDKLGRLNASGQKLRIENVETPGPDEIGVSTIKKFKGLESPVIIIWGLNELSQHDRKELEYVGISRTKSLCYLVN